MPRFAINHMTVANASYASLLSTASLTKCSGVEVRMDLSSPLFDGQDPVSAGLAAKAAGLQIYAVAEVRAFNNFTASTREQAASLIEIANACGAQAVSLIPENSGAKADLLQRRTCLLAAMRELQPMLASCGLIGLIEPLGFATSSLQFKAEAVDAIEQLGAADTFKIVHDTFHHHLCGEKSFYPEHTGIVHISGVVDNKLKRCDMRDEHRVLVDASDRLGNLEQLSALTDAGFNGPVSVEAFAPKVHQFTDPKAQLCGSFEFITTALAASVARI